MKVIFRAGQYESNRQRCPEGERNVLCLHSNDWNDYGSITTFNATFLFDSDLFLEFECKVLVEGNSNSANALHLRKF